MSAKYLHDASPPDPGIPEFRPGRIGKTNLAQHEIHARFTRELVWVLVTILLSLYLATAYVYWAKIESAWPIFR